MNLTLFSEIHFKHLLLCKDFLIPSLKTVICSHISDLTASYVYPHSSSWIFVLRLFIGVAVTITVIDMLFEGMMPVHFCNSRTIDSA